MRARQRTIGEVRQTIADQIHRLTAEAAKARREVGALEHAEAVVARDADRDDETELGESLEHLAGRGDRDAAAILAEIDPFWSKTDDRR